MASSCVVAVQTHVCELIRHGSSSNNAPLPVRCPVSVSSSSIASSSILYDEAALGPRRPRLRLVTIRASAGPDDAQQQQQPESQFGLGGPGTWFGFGKRQERAVGRLAMVGFVAGVVMEVLTGKGILAQLGIDAVAVKYPFLAGLSFLFVGGLLGGYVVVNNPPDFAKVPPNEGAGLPRDPTKTYDPKNADPLTTWTRGGQGSEPYASDLDLPPPTKKE